jgi:UPF0042 nucleotide-binding protein
MPDRDPHRLVIVTGLSGAGKTVALNMLEDLGYYCVDNVPARLLRDFARATVATRDHAYRWMAIGIDARNRPEEIVAIPNTREDLGKLGVTTEIVYLRSEPETLFKRFSETRRRHPLTGEGLDLREAIDREAGLLAPLLERADLVLDTTHTNLHDLRDIVRERVHRLDTRTLSLQFESFAYRHGIPADAACPTRTGNRPCGRSPAGMRRSSSTWPGTPRSPGWWRTWPASSPTGPPASRPRTAPT